jgi:hypothetical protein
MSRKNRLSKKVLQEDRETYAALKNLTDYQPSNTAYSLANVNAAFQAMEAKQTVEVQKKADADGASDDAADSERDTHNIVLGVKAQVKAQYGENSNEYQALGMKKKSEYNLRRRPPAKNNPATP